MNRRHGLLGLAVLLWITSAQAQNRVDEGGQLDRLAAGQGWLTVRSDVRVPLKGWSRTSSLSGAQNVKQAAAGDRRTWSATLADRNGPAVQIEQSVRDEAGKLSFDITATGMQDGNIEGVLFSIRLPTEQFAGGMLAAGEQPVKLPATLPAESVVWSGTAPSLRFTDARGKAAVRVELTGPMKVTVQDNRKWSDEFVANVYVHGGNLPKGQTARGQIRIWAEGEVDTSPARVTVDARQARYRLIGIGGNYCFSIESPVTRYTLENLKVAAARTEMSLRMWEAVNVGGDGLGSDWKEFAKADVPLSRLRREFELMAELTRKKIPFTTSIWRMPGWMTEGASDRDAAKRRIPESQWGDVLQSVGSYLVYAKEKYGAEPDYFSFNEPDIGIDILFTAEAHRDAIKRFGERFEKLGLKTKLILGDVANARGTDKYCLPTANDAAAMKYVGAVAFHSWNGASPQQYAAWGDLAERLKRPLLVNEAGVDPSAWRGGKYRYFAYAMRDMVHYQELLLHARPQSVIYWEFTSDYSLMEGEERGRDAVTERLSLQKHWCNLTPAASEALGVSCDNGGILATAFRNGGGYTIHLANPKWNRAVTVEGLPAEVKELKVVRTARGELYRKLQTVNAADGKVAVELPAESLTTLTTLDTGREP